MSLLFYIPLLDVYRMACTHCIACIYGVFHYFPEEFSVPLLEFDGFVCWMTMEDGWMSINFYVHDSSKTLNTTTKATIAYDESERSVSQH